VAMEALHSQYLNYFGEKQGVIERYTKFDMPKMARASKKTKSTGTAGWAFRG